MNYVIENLRLRELIIIVKQNKKYYNNFLSFLQTKGYNDIYSFINEPSDLKAQLVISDYLKCEFKAQLLDGVGRNYSANKAKWYFLAWILRDPPAQRLEPLLSSIEGKNNLEKKANLLNEIRKFITPLLPEAESWSWTAISEVMLARLEGSRRALKGGLFENIVRNILTEIFKENKLNLKISTKEITLNKETYDISIIGTKGTILIPIKTRETMGGGHAALFTRDIFKSISVASNNNYNCVPIIIAESWSGNLEELPCEHYIFLPINPNQLSEVKLLIKAKLLELLSIFEGLQ